MFNLIIDYPSRDEELSIVKNQNQQDPETIKPVISANDLIEYQKLVENVPVADNVIEYTVDFVKKTRVKDKTNKWLDWGAGPRASTHLILAA